MKQKQIELMRFELHFSHEQLKLLDMPNLRDWVDVEGSNIVFPCLSYMKIKSCQQLKSVPCYFSCLEELHLEKLNEDFPLSNVCGSTSYLRKLNIHELPGLIHLPEGLFVKNEKIWYLRINSCPSLMRLVPSLLGGAASFRELRVLNCESLSELPDDLDTLHSLEMLKISYCPELKSIPSVREGYQGLILLRHLRISHCRELNNLPSELLESCASTISQLWLIFLENLVLSPVFPCLLTLRALIIGGYSEAIDQVSLTHNLNRILQHQPHLEHLTLIGQEDWNSLLVDTQHLTNLKILVLRDFGHCLNGLGIFLLYKNYASGIAKG